MSLNYLINRVSGFDAAQLTAEQPPYCVTNGKIVFNTAHPQAGLWADRMFLDICFHNN